MNADLLASRGLRAFVTIAVLIWVVMVTIDGTRHHHTSGGLADVNEYLAEGFGTAAALMIGRPVERTKNGD